MRSICEILAAHATDKQCQRGHCYGPVYERLFPNPEKVEAVLEIGVGHGYSLAAWRECFPNAVVVGFDFNLPMCQLTDLERIELRDGDQRDRGALWRAANGRRFDLIVDDAGHNLAAQLFSLFALRSFLRAGGYYVIEEFDVLEEGPALVGWRPSIELLLKGARVIDAVNAAGINEPLVVIEG